MIIELYENATTDVVRDLPIGTQAELRLFLETQEAPGVYRSFFGKARANGMTWSLHPIQTRLVPDGARAELWTYGDDYRNPQLVEEGSVSRADAT